MNSFLSFLSSPCHPRYQMCSFSLFYVLSSFSHWVFERWKEKCLVLLFLRVLFPPHSVAVCSGIAVCTGWLLYVFGNFLCFPCGIDFGECSLGAWEGSISLSWQSLRHIVYQGFIPFFWSPAWPCFPSRCPPCTGMNPHLLPVCSFCPVLPGFLCVLCSHTSLP